MNIQEIKTKVSPILLKYNIKRAGIFGSVARGTFDSKSDLDLLIELNEKISLLEFVKIKFELEDVLGLKVDLVEYQTLKPSLKNQILLEEIPIYG